MYHVGKKQFIMRDAAMYLAKVTASKTGVTVFVEDHDPRAKTVTVIGGSFPVMVGRRLEGLWRWRRVCSECKGKGTWDGGYRTFECNKCSGKGETYESED